MWRQDHFWQFRFRCRKSAHRCGAKHVSKSTCAKDTMFGALLEVEMSKIYTWLRREAHFEVKMWKKHLEHFWKLRCSKSARRFSAKHISKWKCAKRLRSQSTFGSSDVEKCTPFWAHSQVKSVKNWRSRSTFWIKLRCRKSARCCGAKHMPKSKCEKHTMFGPLSDVQPHHTTLQLIEISTTITTETATATATTNTTTTITLSYTSLHHTTPLHYHYSHNNNYIYKHNYTTLHPAVVFEVATATTSKSTTPTTFCPSVDLICHPCIVTTHLS